MTEPRQFAPATSRNRDPILGVLARVIPAGAKGLETASGTGEHAVYFAARLPGVTWQPTDREASARASVEAWRAHTALPNVLAPLALDVTDEPWPVDQADVSVCINMIHISPWRATEALLAGAARRLPPSGPLFLYGPFKRGGAHTAPSNEAFDASLRARDPSWGVRDLDDVVRTAAKSGFVLDEVVEMPANNLSVVLRQPPR